MTNPVPSFRGLPVISYRVVVDATGEEIKADSDLTTMLRVTPSNSCRAYRHPNGVYIPADCTQGSVWVRLVWEGLGKK